jgi:hypothetical protein
MRSQTALASETFPRRRRRRSRGSRIRRRCIVGCALLVAVGAIWLAVTALLARQELNTVRAELPALRTALQSGDLHHANEIASSLQTHARRAHQFTSGPAWLVAAEIPWLGRPAQTARTVAAQADLVGRDVLPGVLSLTSDLNIATLRHGATINLAPLVKAAPVLDSASFAATSAASAVANSPTDTWLGAIDSARASFATDLVALRDELVGAARATHILPSMLGESGPKRYFVGFENEAEARGLGGLPGAFAIVTAEHGEITFTQFEDDRALSGVRADVNLGADFTARYAQDDPTGLYVNSDVSANFPDAAQIWAAMWQKKTGETVDGAIALDPSALSYLLEVTGPATLPGGQQVSASNVVALTQKDVYARFAAPTSSGATGRNAANAARKAYLKQIAEAVSQKLLAGGRSTDLIGAAARAARQRRLMVWSADPTVETLLTAANYAGTVQNDGGPYTGFVVNNASGTKLDYYLDRTMTYQRRGCGAAGDSVATFTVTNNAPASGLPTYVTQRADMSPRGARSGDTRLVITYYGTAGATVGSVQVDGNPVIVAPASENGLLSLTFDLELARSATHTITIRLDEPTTNLPLRVLQQPLVRPLHTSIGNGCPPRAGGARNVDALSFRSARHRKGGRIYVKCGSLAGASPFAARGNRS